MTSYELDSSVIHQTWDNSLPPRLEIEPGDSVKFDIRGGSNNYFNRQSTAEDILKKEFSGHPLTGPIAIRGAAPGDVLQVEILELIPWDWGHTTVRPGGGLLGDDITSPYLKI